MHKSWILAMQEREEKLERLKKAVARYKAAHVKQQSQLVEQEKELQTLKDVQLSVYVVPGAKKLQVRFCACARVCLLHAQVWPRASVRLRIIFTMPSHIICRANLGT